MAIFLIGPFFFCIVYAFWAFIYFITKSKYKYKTAVLCIVAVILALICIPVMYSVENNFLNEEQLHTIAPLHKIFS